MTEVREQALVEAPVPVVWDLVGDPSRYTEWLPRVIEILGTRFEEGAEFIQVSRPPLSGRTDVHFLIDSLEELRQIRMHCTVSGLFADWRLTEAQGKTFVEGTFGMDPLRWRDRIVDRTVGRRVLRIWLTEAVEALERAAAQDVDPGAAGTGDRQPTERA